MAGRFRFNKGSVSGAPLPAPGKRANYYDTECVGLVLHVTDSGAKSFYAVARGGNKKQWVRLGRADAISPETARTLCKKELASIAAGVQVNKARKAKRDATKPQVPLADALRAHLKRLQDRGRDEGHREEIERVVGGAVKAGIVDLMAPDAGAKAQKYLDKLTTPSGKELSPHTQRRYRGHLRSIVRTAMKLYPNLMRDPFMGLDTAEPSGDMPPVFSPAECCALVSDESLAQPYGLAMALWLYSGVRLREGLWIRWDRIDLDDARLDVTPPTPDERAAGYKVKRDKARSVPLQPELVEILRPLRPASGAGYVFPDSMRICAHVTCSRAFRRHLKSIKLPLEGRHIHSLRHTHAALALAAGEDGLRLRIYLGHASEDMTRHYAAQMMRWRSQVKQWKGIWKLRDPVEIARITNALTTEPCSVTA